MNLLEDKHQEGRVYVSTYPTMMGLIDEADAGERRFGVGHFDLVVIDEAHRSVYRKYKAIFEYFDSLLVGLTATPKGEVDRDTYRLFDLQTGVPTDAYGLDEAVKDGFLVPPKAVSLTTDFLDRGIRYDQLSDEEKEAWDALEWDDSGTVPGAVDAPALNKWLFNADTVDRVLQHLMTHGIKVEDGDRLGKTIIFAKNRAHAEFIGARFDANYPHLAGHFARVIVSEYSYAQSLVDDLYDPNKPPHIAISVDMLDTGIDVPEIVNLVFFKPVRSKTKFWQMIGRGTRLCPDLFGPGRHKEFFYIFDWCRNFEFFNQNPDVTEGAGADTLAKRLFAARVELVGEVDGKSRTRRHGYVQDPRLTVTWVNGSEPIARRDQEAARWSCGRTADRDFRHEPRQLPRPAAPPLRRKVQFRGSLGESRCGCAARIDRPRCRASVGGRGRRSCRQAVRPRGFQGRTRAAACRSCLPRSQSKDHGDRFAARRTWQRADGGGGNGADPGSSDRRVLAGHHAADA